MRSLKNSKLYLILDADVHPYEELLKIARQSVEAGVDIIQLRDKKGTARDILTFSEKLKKIIKRRIPFIINDRIDVALAAGASGVHLGQEDLSITLARKLMGPRAIIGVSCQNLKAAKIAQTQGANYIGFGSAFRNLTKPKRRPMDLRLLHRVIGQIRIPMFAIGGINITNLRILAHQGVRRIAVCRAICEARDIAKTVKLFREQLDQLQ